MHLIDRLIDRARMIQFSCGDGVFIISNETGKWMVEGREFPDPDAAQAYVESLLPDGVPDSTVIINDLGPRDPAALRELAVPEDWLDRLREENQERLRQEWEKEQKDRPPEKDRRLI